MMRGPAAVIGMSIETFASLPVSFTTSTSVLQITPGPNVVPTTGTTVVTSSCAPAVPVSARNSNSRRIDLIANFDVSDYV
jgi:hypothetical protein